MAIDGEWAVDWLDAGREPECSPNPKYPNGIDINAACDDMPACMVRLPYPARRCGSYVVKCLRCGLTAAITTAGRPDDPRSLTINCRRSE